MDKTPSIKLSKEENLVSIYFSEKGLLVVPIPKIQTSDTPDFLIRRDNSGLFYCEVKSPVLELDKETGMYKWKTTYSKILTHIHKAVKQFQAKDKDHSLPWILVVTSTHMQLNFSSLGNCINGFVGTDANIADLRGSDAVKRSAFDFKTLDAMIWLQVDHQENKISRKSIFINQDSSKIQETSLIVDLLFLEPRNWLNQVISYR